MWPVNREKVMSVPRPISEEDMHTLATVEDMSAMYQEYRRNALKAILGEHGVVSRSGFVDTTRGLVLTSYGALAVAAAKVAEWRAK